MKIRLDHLVVAALDLQQGVDYIEDKLGVVVPFGGEHLKMGTHNHLIQLGNDVFLEVIAINPELSPPQRPRWFGLDDPLVQMSLERGPRLIAWVVNCDNIKEAVGKGGCSFGHPELITRGELSWYFGLPADGRLLGGGFLPYLIQWNTDVHPSKKMSDVGVQLLEFEIQHPHADWLKKNLLTIGASDLVKISALAVGKKPHLRALFSTPGGTKELVS